MVKSMTSFGRAQSEEEDKYLLSVEMKSVNNRYLDINIRMPKFMIALEEMVRKQVTSKLTRGKVDIFINYKSYGESKGNLKLDKVLAKKYYDLLKELEESLNIKSDITLSKIAKYPDIISFEEKEENLDEVSSKLKIAVEESLQKMLNMREAEGAKLKEDIILKLQKIKEKVKGIEEIAEAMPKDYKKRLEERIQSLTDGVSIDKERLTTEIAIFVDKISIDEEIIRIKSHITQMKNTLDDEDTIGRKLDFIIQEINRETNTMGSKSNDINLTNFVIDIKNILEKIREQVQNIE